VLNGIQLVYFEITQRYGQFKYKLHATFNQSLLTYHSFSLTWNTLTTGHANLRFFFLVFALQLWNTDDANSCFNTRLVFTHLITQYMESLKNGPTGRIFKKKWLYFVLNIDEKNTGRQSVNFSAMCKQAIPLQAMTGPEGSRRLRLPDFKTIDTWRWQSCQPYAPAAFTPRKYTWYSFLLEAELTPGP
jgi:hypothetical protein